MLSLFTRSWQARRVRWTQEVLHICRVGQLKTIDYIPMHEISSILETCDLASSSPWASVSVRDQQGSSRISECSFKIRPSDLRNDGKIMDSEPQADVDKVRHNFKNLFQRRYAPGKTNTMQIKTIREGYNSGRTYNFRSKSDADSRLLIEAWNGLASIARSKADVRSQFEMIQLKFRNLYNASSFQAIIVLLITTVWGLQKYHSLARLFIDCFFHGFE